MKIQLFNYPALPIPSLSARAKKENIKYFQTEKIRKWEKFAEFAYKLVSTWLQNSKEMFNGFKCLASLNPQTWWFYHLTDICWLEQVHVSKSHNILALNLSYRKGRVLVTKATHAFVRVWTQTVHYILHYNHGDWLNVVMWVSCRHFS